MGIGWILMVLFWVVVIGLIVWAVSTLLPGPRQSRPPTAVEILDRRFAQGEFDVEQYWSR